MIASWSTVFRKENGGSAPVFIHGKRKRRTVIAWQYGNICDSEKLLPYTVLNCKAAANAFATLLKIVWSANASEITVKIWNLFKFLNHHLCGFIYITATEGDDKVAFFSMLKHVVNNFFKSIVPYTAGNLICKIFCINVVSVYFS